MPFANRPTGKVELITRDGIAIDITDDQHPELRTAVHVIVKGALIGIPCFITLKIIAGYLMMIV